MENIIPNWIETKIRNEIPGIAPSGDHDLIDEVLGLLRVARQQRDDLERWVSRPALSKRLADIEIAER